MPTMDSFKWEKEYLGEYGMYPGHPVIGACMIMVRYPNLAAAKHRPPGQSSGNALADSFIPGAGCAVYAALEVLQRAQSAGLEAAYAHADDYWDGWERQHPNNVTRAANGRTQAERVKPLFEAWLKAWDTPNDPGSPYRRTDIENLVPAAA